MLACTCLLIRTSLHSGIEALLGVSLSSTCMVSCAEKADQANDSGTGSSAERFIEQTLRPNIKIELKEPVSEAVQDPEPPAGQSRINNNYDALSCAIGNVALLVSLAIAQKCLAAYKVSPALMPDAPVLLLPCTSLPEFTLVHVKRTWLCFPCGQARYPFYSFKASEGRPCYWYCLRAAA